MIKKWVVFLLKADCRQLHMAGVNGVVIRQREQLAADTCKQLIVIASG